MSAQKPKAPEEPIPLPAKLPALPAPVGEFLKYIEQNPGVPVRQLMTPFLEYEAVLRAYFAQAPDHEFVQGHVNLVSLFEDGNADLLRIRARSMPNETSEEAGKYVMSLEDKERKANGDRILVESLKEFRNNFGIFSEGSLLNLDWSNIIAAGSSVTTPLLKVPPEYAQNRKALREYYHEKLAPASDIDLFIYGIEDPEEAIKKMAAVEDTVKNNLLWETTTVRTRNTVTIVSQYPNRHVQIVLRLYKSPAQILTGFDVPCSCFAYDGQHVLANPRALAACMTQCNDIDLSRRSPSYESRLSKYSHRGFEVYCGFLDRTRVDPSIYERSFARTVGLARLLVLEALPKPVDRERYVEKRRIEMGRPQRFTTSKAPRPTTDIKTFATDEVAEWDFEDVSGYQKFSIPYGVDYNAKRIEKLFFKKDLLLNAEWNPANNPPSRMVTLHRHPVFFGTVSDVVVDCCGFCPVPLNSQDRKVFAEEEKTFVNGAITFLSDDPGRQEIGSFCPLGPEDYTDMAYVGSTGRLCEAIVDNDVSYVASWCAQEGVNLDTRDFCGRTPLQLACMNTGTELEMVKTLVDAGARLVARMQDGRTALHLAAARGRADMVKVLLDKSAENEHERDEKEAKKNERIREEREEDDIDIEVTDGEDTDVDGNSDKSYDDMSDVDSSKAGTNTTRGFVKVGKVMEPDTLDDDNAEDGDDIYDINIVDWDNGMSPLHHAIVGGHEEVVEALVSGFGADVLLPIKTYEQSNYRKKRADAILNLVLALKLRDNKKKAEMAGTLLKLGASSVQANSFHKTSALHYVMLAGCAEVLDKMFELDGPGAMSVINNISNGPQSQYGTPTTPLITALVTSKHLVNCILDHGARGAITKDDYLQSLDRWARNPNSGFGIPKAFGQGIMQPIEVAASFELTSDIIARLIKAGADPSTITQQTWAAATHNDELPTEGQTVLEIVRANIGRCQEFLAREEKIPQFKERVLFDPEVLYAYEPGSYQRFCAEQQLITQNKARKKHNKSKMPAEDTERESLALQRKKVAVEQLLESLKETEKTLVDAGAKTYHELFPEKLELVLKQREAERLWKLNQPPAPQWPVSFGLFGNIQPGGFNSVPPGLFNPVVAEDTDHIFTVDNSFNAPYLGEGDIQGAYLRLFEAIWRGTPEDANLVKELALGPTGEGKSTLPALRISVADHQGYTTLWLALYRRNWDMAKLIVSIVAEQYELPSRSTQEMRYVLECNSSQSSSDEIQMDLFATEFTIDNIGAKRDLVKCSVSPSCFLVTRMHPSVLLGNKVNKERLKAGNQQETHGWTPLSYAIYKNDMELFHFVLSLVEGTKEEDGVANYIDSDPSSSNSFFGQGRAPTYGNASHLRLALILGRIEMLEEIMKTVSFGISWSELEEADEELQMQKPQYYQGLTVYGTKRKDWASNSYPAFGTRSGQVQKPVQIAVYFGQLQSIKWLLSDRPFKCLQEFMKAHPGSTRTRLLTKQGDGLGFLLQKGLGVETSLLAHLATKGWVDTYPMETFRFLLSRPGALLARTNLHLNLPLYAVQGAANQSHKKAVIAELRRPEYHEADFAARDCMGRNIAHHALVPGGWGMVTDERNLAEILGLLPGTVLETAWTQRMLGTSQTPLAYWLSAHTGKVHIPTLRVILEYSKGRELGIANGEGNLPIHWAYQAGHHEAARIITELAPQYIHTENANGRTPIEIATACYLLHICQNPPLPPGGYSRYVHQSVVSTDLSFFYPENKARKERPLVSLGGFGGFGGLRASGGGRVGAVLDQVAIVATYNLAVSVGKSTPGKRKLVSLADANELAKRITGGTGQSVGSFDGGDILSLW